MSEKLDIVPTPSSFSPFTGPSSSASASASTAISITSQADQRRSLSVFYNYLRTHRNPTFLNRNLQRAFELQKEALNGVKSTAGREHLLRPFWHMPGTRTKSPVVGQPPNQPAPHGPPENDSICIDDDSENVDDQGCERQGARRHRKSEFIAPHGVFSSRSMTPLRPGARFYGESDEDSDEDDEEQVDDKCRDRLEKHPKLTADQIEFLALHDRLLRRVRPKIESNVRYKKWFVKNFIRQNKGELQKKGLVNEALLKANELLKSLVLDQSDYNNCCYILKDRGDAFGEPNQDTKDGDTLPYSECLCGSIALRRKEQVIECRSRGCIRRTFHIRCVNTYWRENLPRDCTISTAAGQWHCRECKRITKGKERAY